MTNFKYGNNPKDYYFCEVDEDYYGEFGMGDSDDPDPPVFRITPRKYYDKYRYLYEGPTPYDMFPNGFAEVMEAHFERVGPKEESRQLLLDAGFVEKKI